MKRTLIAVAAILLLPALGMAQSGSLTIVTDPPGAEVALAGEASLAGVSPVTFGYLLIGEYHLTISKPGFESYSTTLIVDPSRSQQVDVTLTAKTAAKATLRSILIPGWGQKYSGQKAKSLVLGGLFFGTAIYMYKKHRDVLDLRDEFDNRLAEYDRSVAAGGGITEQERLYHELSVSQQTTYDAEGDRKTAAIVTMGIWGLNVIDAIFFTPTERATFSIKGLTITPSTDLSGAGLTFTMAF